MKLFGLILTLTLFGYVKSSSVDLECYYPPSDVCEGTFKSPIHYPDVSINFNVNMTVKEFKVTKGQVFYFPRGLKEKFPNVIKITIEGTGLREIHRVDLAPFGDLNTLSLERNSLRAIEKDLFEFNTQLTAIKLNNNGIKYVHPKVFDNLKQLSYLGFQINKCFNRDMSGPNPQFYKSINDLYNNCFKSAEVDNSEAFDLFNRQLTKVDKMLDQNSQSPEIFDIKTIVILTLFSIIILLLIILIIMHAVHMRSSIAVIDPHPGDSPRMSFDAHYTTLSSLQAQLANRKVSRISTLWNRRRSSVKPSTLQQQYVSPLDTVGYSEPETFHYDELPDCKNEADYEEIEPEKSKGFVEEIPVYAEPDKKKKSSKTQENKL